MSRPVPDGRRKVSDAVVGVRGRCEIPQPAQEKRGQGTDHGHDQRVCILRVVERHANLLKGRFGYLPIV